SSTLFWLFPFPRAIFLVAPLFYLFFDLQIFTASSGEFLAYTIAYMAVNLMMQNYMYGSFRWPWISELYEYVQTVHLLPAVISVILNPRKPTFKVTAKDESVLYNRLSEISMPFFVIFAVLLAGVGVTVYRVIAEPYRADLTLMVGGWNLLNLFIAGCALGVVSERGIKSQSRRVTVSRRAEVLFGEHVFPATIDNVSVGGAGLRVFCATPQDLLKGSSAALRFKPHQSSETVVLPILLRAVQKEPGGLVIGCSYVTQKATDHFLVADLIFANSEQWRDFQLGRRYNPGLLRGTLWFFGMCVFQTYRGLSYLVRGKNGHRDSAALPVPSGALK
ncbi:MAG: cellulose synthase catalytic subunit (UDP-forming), partial [Hyphomicrobiales bacterium]